MQRDCPAVLSVPLRAVGWLHAKSPPAGRVETCPNSRLAESARGCRRGRVVVAIDPLAEGQAPIGHRRPADDIRLLDPLPVHEHVFALDPTSSPGSAITRLM
jgi:hypothetical protein